MIYALWDLVLKCEYLFCYHFCFWLGRRKLVLRHSILIFRRILESLRVEWQNSMMLRFASLPEWENKKYTNILFLRVGIEPKTVAFIVARLSATTASTTMSIKQLKNIIFTTISKKYIDYHILQRILTKNV